jgi:hypothetical protein
MFPEDAMAKQKRREKLTLEIEPDLRKSLAKWACEEGRPVGNLLRRIVAKAIQDQGVRRDPPRDGGRMSASAA